LEAAITAYAQEAPYCPSDQVDQLRVNIFVVPVVSFRPSDADRSLCKDSNAVAAQLLADYDTARAGALADKAGFDGQGPYLVASLKPLSTLRREDRKNLLTWDISGMEPKLVSLAVNEFITSANRPDDWSPISMRKWALDLRNWIAIAAQGWNISREAAASAVKGPN
jgi:hypothetical protein